MSSQRPPRPTGQSPDALRPLLALGGTFVTQMAAAFGFMAFALLAPGLAAETGLNERDFSLTITFIFLATALTSPFTGRMMRRLGALWTTVTMLAGMAAAALLVLHGSWWSAMLASFCFGVFYGPFSPASMTIMMRNAPARRRGLLLAVRHTSVPLAGVIAGRLLPPLMLAFGWQLGVLSISGAVLAAALFALAFAAAFRLPDDRTDADKRSASTPAGLSVADRLTTYFHAPPELRLLWGAALCFAVTQVAMTTMTYFFVLEVLELSPVAGGIFASNIQIAGVVGRPLLGWLSDRTGAPLLVLAAIALASSLAALLLLLAPPGLPDVLLVTLALLCGLAGQTWNPVFVTAMSFRVAPERQAEMNGRAFSVASIGWTATAPVFWGLIELTGSYDLPFALIMIANAVLALLLVRRADS